MRKVLSSTREVFHYWANKVQPEGRAGNVFFEGDRAYSYGRHFCIARHLPGGAVAFTTRSYSPTTSGHVSDARQSARHLRVVFCNDPSDPASENLRAAKQSMNIALLNEQKPRIRANTRVAHRAHALNVAQQFNAYLAALPETERGAIQPIDTSDLDSIRDDLARIEREKTAAQARAAAARQIEAQEHLVIWRAGGIYDPVIGYAQCALRISGDDVETSRGARIPVSDALKLWPMIQRVMRGEKDYAPGEPLGVYRLTQIRHDGSVKIGCHDIAYPEIHGIAVQLGLVATS